MKTPRLPTPYTPVDADWGRQVVESIRERTISVCPPLMMNATPQGVSLSILKSLPNNFEQHLPFELRIRGTALQMWLPGINTSLVTRNGYPVKPTTWLLTKAGWVDISEISTGTDYSIWVDLCNTEEFRPEYPPTAEANIWRMVVAADDAPTPVELRTPILLGIISAGKLIPLRSPGRIDTYSYPPDSINIGTETTFRSTAFNEIGEIQLFGFKALETITKEDIESASRCDVVLRYKSESATTTDVAYTSMAELLAALYDKLKEEEDPWPHDPYNPDPYDLLSRDCDLDSNGVYVYDPCMNGIPGTGNGGFVKKYFWERGEAEKKCYGSAIGDSNKAKVLDLDVHVLLDGWTVEDGSAVLSADFSSRSLHDANGDAKLYWGFQQLLGPWECTGALKMMALEIGEDEFYPEEITFVTSVDFLSQTYTTSTMTVLKKS